MILLPSGRYTTYLAGFALPFIIVGGDHVCEMQAEDFGIVVIGCSECVPAFLSAVRPHVPTNRNDFFPGQLDKPLCHNHALFAVSQQTAILITVLVECSFVVLVDLANVVQECRHQHGVLVAVLKGVVGFAQFHCRIRNIDGVGY